MYLNKALIIGNLTRDPELRSLPSGIQVATFGVATNRVYKDKEGNKKEQADFHNVVVFGRQAETSAQYLKKGFGAKGSGSAGGASKQTAGATSEPLGGKQPDAIEYPQEEINPEDIPF